MTSITHFGDSEPLFGQGMTYVVPEPNALLIMAGCAAATGLWRRHTRKLASRAN
ncbi:MAG: hypothetical protein HY287_11220 [Planctomycetes bacterium]|nr:hypothetical protein [Planctomycetota bacterium]